MNNTPHFRPQKPLYDVIVEKWLTLTNFAWFLTAVLVFVLLMLAINSAKKLAGDEEYPYQLVAMSGSTLDMTLRDMDTKSAVVMLYDSTCGEMCEKQISTLLNLRELEGKNEMKLMLLSMDDTPEATMEYLKKIRLPETMVTYYVNPEGRNAVKTTLDRTGSTGVDYSYPHTLLIGKPRKMIVEYKGYVRSQEIVRSQRLNSLNMPDTQR